MKKTLAMLLALAMVSALCGMLFVSAESTNLAAGKEVQNAAVNGVNNAYNANLTDGAAAAEISYDGNWFAFYYHPDKSNDENQASGANSVEGVASPTIDLGAVYALDQVRINAFLGNSSGIGAPSAISVEVSTDGETYTKLGEESYDLPSADGDDAKKVAWVEFDVDVEAQYVRINLTHVLTWVFVNEIEIYGAEAADDDPSEAPSEDPSEDPSEAPSEDPSEDPSEAPSEAPSEDSKPQTGDAGILVFAVLGVVAICGAAVAIKARG